MEKRKWELLTWEDIKEIIMASDSVFDKDIKGELPPACESEEGYFSEILNTIRVK